MEYINKNGNRLQNKKIFKCLVILKENSYLNENQIRIVELQHENIKIIEDSKNQKILFIYKLNLYIIFRKLNQNSKSKMLQENLNLVAFLQKTYRILNNPEYNDIITWDTNGKYLSILDSLAFQTQVLPIYFKHKNIKSFIRQLNLYGFRKVKRTFCKNTFFHPNFQRDDKTTLSTIRRRKGRKNAQLNSIIQLAPLTRSTSDTASNFSKNESISKEEQPAFLNENIKQDPNDLLDLDIFRQNLEVWGEEPFLIADILEQNIFMYV